MKRVSFNETLNEKFEVVCEVVFEQQKWAEWTSFGVMMREKGLVSPDVPDAVVRFRAGQKARAKLRAKAERRAKLSAIFAVIALMRRQP